MIYPTATRVAAGEGNNVLIQQRRWPNSLFTRAFSALRRIDVRLRPCNRSVASAHTRALFARQLLLYIMEVMWNSRAGISRSPHPLIRLPLSPVPLPGSSRPLLPPLTRS